MICHTIAAQIRAIEEVFRAVKSGELSKEQIEASVKRVQALKAKYLSADKDTYVSTQEERERRYSKQASMATEIYSQSTTLVRTTKIIPISSIQSKIVFVRPGKTRISGGVVKSGGENIQEPYTPDKYIDVLKKHHQNIIEIRLFDNIALSKEEEDSIHSADVVILATWNATLSSYQKELGISLGKTLGQKLIVVATCDPYDFLDMKEDIKNYITIYEPTVPAFQAAVDVIFGIKDAKGSLPISKSAINHDIRDMNMSQEDIKKLWSLWQEIFPKWKMDLPRLTKILQQPHGRHYLHEKGFCMSFLMAGPHGKIAAVGVLPDYRCRGLGTAFVTKAQTDLRKRAVDEDAGALRSLAFGSVFPRLWCQPPIDLAQSDKDFLLHRGLPQCSSKIMTVLKLKQ